MTPENQPETPSEAAPRAGLTVKRRLALAWLALSWERIWVRLWIVGSLLGIFGIVLMTDVLPSLHWAVHAAVVIAAAVGIGYTVWRRLKGFTWPTRDEARARLETTSPVEHRPLTTIEDSLVAGATAVQQWIWRLHQSRARDDLDRLRVKGPSPGIANRDRFALRAAVILALFVAVIGAWNDIGHRLLRGALPMFGNEASTAAVKLWITPPDYTQLSPIYLESPVAPGTTPPSVIEVPEGSKVLTVVTGTANATTLAFADINQPLEKLADKSLRGEADLKSSGSIDLRQGPRTIASWKIHWIPDTAPIVILQGPPGEAPHSHTHIDYVARDDYGVEAVTARITKPDDTLIPPLEFPLDMPPTGGNVLAFSSVHDLASHIWAGEKVRIAVTATDHAQHKGSTAEIDFTMPLRVFKHPVSRELAKWRKDLVYKPKETMPAALESVTNILASPEFFGREPVVQLTLLTAKYRMSHDAPADVSNSVAELMWHAAVRIEDGNLVNAEQRLAAAEKALKDAIARGASPDEIAAKLKDLQEAVAEYQKAMDDQGQDRKGTSKTDKAEMDALKKSMDDIKQLTEMGANDAAKDALNKLQDQLQALRDKDKEKNTDVAEAKKMLEKMQKLGEDQAKLLDENFKKQKEQEAKDKKEGGNTPPMGGPPNADQNKSDSKSASSKPDKGDSAAAQAAAGKQEDLRKELSEVMNQLQDMNGKTPEGMQDAEKAMADARDALKSAQWKEGAEGQSKAQQKLDDGINQAKEQIMQRMLEKGLGGTDLAKAQALKFSPLGAKDGRRGGEQVEIPGGPDTEGMAQRVRVILEEIRKRAADRTRPEAEQDYLRRLKKQF